MPVSRVEWSCETHGPFLALQATDEPDFWKAEIVMASVTGIPITMTFSVRFYFSSWETTLNLQWPNGRAEPIVTSLSSSYEIPMTTTFGITLVLPVYVPLARLPGSL